VTGRIARPMRNGHGVAIIGAGPAGLQTAIGLRKAGMDPVVFEARAAGGAHKLCAGLISRAGVESLGIRLEGCLENRVRGARLYSPGGVLLEVARPQAVAYVVDRRSFDQGLLRQARQMGIAICPGTRLVDRDGGALVLRQDGRCLRWNYDVVVGADGAGSMTRRLFGMDYGAGPVLHTAQAVCTGTFDPDFVEVRLGGFAPGFFGWLIPMGAGSAKIGLGSTADTDCAPGLRAFIARTWPGARAQRVVRGVIPLGAPLPRIQASNVALVGDAACHVKATSGGGIVFGMKAGAHLAASIDDYLRRGTPLASYERRLAGLTRELRLHWKIRSWYNALRDAEVDELFSRLKDEGIEEFLSAKGDMDCPSRFLPRLALKPGYWFMAGTLAAIAMA
jgi:digeranylgeranylglycerophospholipid reductase